MHPARELERRREARGECIRCGAPTPGVAERKRVSGRAPARMICRPCLDRKSAAATAIDHRRVERGLCVRCGIPLINRAVRECAHCRSQERYWYAKRHGLPVPEVLPPRTRTTAPDLDPQTVARYEPRTTARRRLRASAGAQMPIGVLPGRAERPCSACGSMFRVTARRRRFFAGLATPKATTGRWPREFARARPSARAWAT